MIEIKGNLWDYWNPAHVVLITTNGTLKKNGECVMGRGCALEAKQRMPWIAKRLGDQLKQRGNVPSLLTEEPLSPIFSFPVKHNWWEEADLDLIKRSLEGLYEIMATIGFQKQPFILPRPGCGNGRLTWEQVKPLFVPVSNRVWVITK